MALETRQKDHFVSMFRQKQHLDGVYGTIFPILRVLSDFPSDFFEVTFQWFFFLKIEARYARNLSY